MTRDVPRTYALLHAQRLLQPGDHFGLPVFLRKNSNVELMRRFPIGTRNANRRESVWQSRVKRGRSDLVAGDPAESAEVDWECLALEIDAGDQYCNG